MKTGSLPRRLSVIVACFLLFLGFEIGAARQAGPSGPGAAVAVVLRDGSLASGTTRLASLEVETEYGKLVVPISEVKHIKFGEGGAARTTGSREESLDELRAKAFLIRGVIHLDAIEINTPYGRMNVSRNDLVSVAFAPADDSPSLIQGLVAHWTMDETRGNTAHDSGPHEMDGNLAEYSTNDKRWVEGRIGNALYFNGATNYVVVPGSERILNPGVKDWTIAAWVKTRVCDRPGYSQSLVNKRQRDPGDHQLVLTIGGPRSEGQLRRAAFSYDTDNLGAGVHGETDVCDDKWHHLAGVRTGATLKVYVDGALEGQTTDRKVPESIESSTPLQLGMQRTWDGWSSPRFEGALDDVRIYSRELRVEEIKILARQK